MSQLLFVPGVKALYASVDKLYLGLCLAGGRKAFW